MSDSVDGASLYDRLAVYYDLEHERYDADVPFYAEYARRTGGPLLELGVGTGRVLIRLVQLGFEGAGIDTSRRMLDLAERRARELGVRDHIDLIHADMAAFSLPGRPLAGLAYAALDSFLELETQPRQLAALRAVRPCLQPDGLLVLDLLNPHPEILAEPGGEVLAGPVLESAEGPVAKFAARFLDPVAQTIEARIWYDERTPDGAIRRLTLSLQQRYLHLAEIDLLFRLSGFERIQTFGSYDLDAYGPNSERLLVVARVAALAS